jgi:hypothetical protein
MYSYRNDLFNHEVYYYLLHRIFYCTKFPRHTHSRLDILGRRKNTQGKKIGWQGLNKHREITISSLWARIITIFKSVPGNTFDRLSRKCRKGLFQWEGNASIDTIPSIMARYQWSNDDLSSNNCVSIHSGASF